MMALHRWPVPTGGLLNFVVAGERADNPSTAEPDVAGGRQDRCWAPPPRFALWHWAWITAAIVLAVSILLVAVSRMKPAYDAYGWLGRGRQTLHWNLNTDGRRRGKPLTFIITLPYALVMPAQPWLLVTSVAGSLSGAVFGGSHRLQAHRSESTPPLRAGGRRRVRGPTRCSSQQRSARTATLHRRLASG